MPQREEKIAGNVVDFMTESTKTTAKCYGTNKNTFYARTLAKLK